MQTNNFNKTDDDLGFDRVLVSVQDPRGSNGADFAIVPEYVHPVRVCRLAFLTHEQWPVL